MIPSLDPIMLPLQSTEDRHKMNRKTKVSGERVRVRRGRGRFQDRKIIPLTLSRSHRIIFACLKFKMQCMKNEGVMR
jgi:hypothetical protein